ncbi:MAG: glycerophosphodiester phosphodiesterase, partial [Sphaerochaetaceae bacterium]
VDVRSTQDGILILSHDPTIGRYLISDHSFAFLQQCDSNLVTLEEALMKTQKHNISLNLDLKDISAARAMYTLIRNTRCNETVVVSGCHREAYELVHSFAPSLRIMLNIEADELNNLAQYRKLNPYGLNLDYRLLTDSFMQEAHKWEFPIFVWTVDNEKDIRSCLAAGVSGITTNRPDLFFHCISGK